MPGWNLFPHFIVRATGFPWELVERIRCIRSGELGRAWRREHAALEHVRANGPRLHNPPRSVLASLRAGRPITRLQVENADQFAEWNRVATALQEAQTQFEETFEREMIQSHAALKQIAADGRFLEAIASSSPPVFTDLEKGRWSARVERQLASYVQRLSSKNETMSYFGPINYGVIDPRLPGGVQVHWSGPLHLTGRQTYAASWLVQGVAQRIAFDPAIAAWLVPRRKGFADPPLPRRRRRLGEILLERGTLTAPQLSRALERQPAHGRMLGELLVFSAICSQEEIDEALTLQASSSPLTRMDGSDAADAAENLSRLVRAANGTKTVSHLADELKISVSAAVEGVRTACEKRVLTHQLELPAASHHPLRELSERLSGIPGPSARQHLSAIGEVLRWMEQYGAADAASKVRLNDQLRKYVEATWGLASPHVRAEDRPLIDDRPSEITTNPGLTSSDRGRTESHAYVDRLPMREECGGDLRISIGGGRAQELLRRLERPLDLLASAAENTRRMARERLASLIGERRIPFWKVVAAFADKSVPYDDSLSIAVAKAISDPKASLFAIDSALPLPTPKASGLPVICSVDLLIAAADVAAWDRGEYEIVMGDIHDTALVWGWALQFHERRAQVEAEMVQMLGNLARPIPVVTALASRRTGLLPAEFPGPVIELGGVSVRSSAWHLPFDDLSVISDGSTVKLWSESLASEVCLYNGELESLVHTAFALPRIRPPRVDLGAHTPRLVWNGVVLQREQWRLSPEHVAEMLACKDDRSRLIAALRVWEDLSLPEFVFAKLSDERKPVLVDPYSPLMLRTFINLLEHRKGAVLSEMHPNPSQLWLSGPLGRHTAELRCTFARGA